MWRRLQPHVPEAAIHARRRLQPCVPEASPHASGRNPNPHAATLALMREATLALMPQATLSVDASVCQMCSARASEPACDPCATQP